MTGFSSPNHTETPNDLFDVYMLDMGECELKVTLAIIRKTLGFHKKSDPISLSQLQQLTGLSRQGASDGVNAAIKRGLVEIVGTGKRGVIIYGLVINSDQSTEETTSSQQNRPVTSQKSRHTKEKETKETSQKKEEKDSAPDGASPSEPPVSEVVENPSIPGLPAQVGIPTPSEDQSPAQAPASTPSKVPQKVPPAVNKWSDARLNEYYLEHQTEIDLIDGARGVDHSRVPFKNCMVGDQRETIKLHMAILARQLIVADYIKFLRENLFKWQKPMRLSHAQLKTNIAVYESQLYPLAAKVQEIDPTPGVRPARIIVGSEWVNVEDYEREKGKTA